MGGWSGGTTASRWVEQGNPWWWWHIHQKPSMYWLSYSKVSILGHWRWSRCSSLTWFVRWYALKPLSNVLITLSNVLITLSNVTDEVREVIRLETAFTHLQKQWLCCWCVVNVLPMTVLLTCCYKNRPEMTWRTVKSVANVLLTVLLMCCYRRQMTWRTAKRTRICCAWTARRCALSAFS